MNPKSDLKSLSHNALIEFMAMHHGDNAAWAEFMRRYQKFIVAIIIKECQRIHYHQAGERINDLLQSVYARLLNDSSKALKNFKGQYENSIISYLKLITLNVVRSDFKQNTRHSYVELVDSKDELIDLIPDYSLENEISGRAMFDFLNQHLSVISKQRRKGERDILIFQYSLFGNLSNEEIAKKPDFKDLSSKRIANIIAEIKDDLRSAFALQGLV